MASCCVTPPLGKWKPVGDRECVVPQPSYRGITGGQSARVPPQKLSTRKFLLAAREKGSKEKSKETENGEGHEEKWKREGG